MVAQQEMTNGAMSNEIQEKCSDKEEFLTKKHQLNMHLDECSKKTNALGVQESGILGQVRDRVAESPLKERKKVMAEIANLERSKPGINEQMGGLMEEKGHAAAFGQLISERRNVTGCIEGLFDQRDELNRKVQAKKKTARC